MNPVIDIIMFSSQGLFKGISCPGGNNCRLPNCIFSHEATSKPSDTATPFHLADVDADAGGDRKRVKLSNDSDNHPLAAQILERKPFVGILTSKVNKSENVGRADKSDSLSRPISPPPSSRNGAQTPKTKSAKSASGLWLDFSLPVQPKEDLNPRLIGIGSSCAPHNTRLSLLRMLHAQMTRLDGETIADSDAETQKRRVHPDNLVQLALDEEQRIVKVAGPNYRVTMGHTLVKYKNMKVKDWLAFLDSKTAPPEKPKLSDPFSTDLGLHLERILISRYIINLDGLDKYGYILEAPSEEKVTAARIAVEKCDNWEACDRCSTRFQVFPNRRDDGALTSGNTCRYHWGRAYKNKDTKERLYSCCGAVAGQPGCSTHDTHVFKTSDPARLAGYLQFKQTPDNCNVKSATTVSFDCEMGYTTLGMEMIRVSAVLWPSNERLIDTLVRPYGQILDLNTRFSGVSPDQFLNAMDYTPPLDGSFTHEAMIASMEDNKEPILPSPEVARSLLFSFISPTTPLIGHSIDNDLNVMRIIHPTIVDTVVLYPFPQGFPYRYGLKKLTKEHLMRDIQTAGAEGHDSMEDARATGDLVRAKLAKEWILLKSVGWKIVGSEQQQQRKFVPPENWIEKGAGKAYLMPLEKWWDVAIADGNDGEINSDGKNQVDLEKDVAVAKRRSISSSSPLVKKSK